jgi:hypothetical protein
MVHKILDRIEQKDFGGLNSIIGVNGQNPASQEVFFRLTGVKLGNTQKERVAQLEAWAGVERVRESKEKAARSLESRQEEQLLKALRQSYETLKYANIRVTEDDGKVRVLNGQEYVGHKVSLGMEFVRATKEGAATARYLYNPETGAMSGTRDKRFGEFLKRVQTIEINGNVPKAMEKADLKLPIPKGMDVTPDPVPPDRGPESKYPQMPGGPENVTILSSSRGMGTLGTISATVISVSDDGFSARIQHAGQEKRLELARADYRAGARLPSLPTGTVGELRITPDRNVEFQPRQKELAHKKQQSLGI